MKPRLLDLFCGAGGCTKGFQRAGFYVVGVDNRPQPHYCGDEFVQADALWALHILERGGALAAEGTYRLRDFAAIAASPPCQFGSSLRSLHKERDYVNLIGPTRELLQATGLPYIIENVEQARKFLHGPIYVCGSMFDPPMDIQRHRYFETNWPLQPPMWPCRHGLWDFRYRSLDKRKRRGSRVMQVHGGGQTVPMSRTVGVHGHVNYTGEADLRRAAMGIDWMTMKELSQAIPPAYTEFIGAQLLAALSVPAGYDQGL